MHRFFPGLCGVFLLATQAFTIKAHAVTLAVPENLAPWGLAASQPPGQRGIYADLADALAKESHTPIEVRFLPYGRMLQEIKSGNVDYAFGLIGPATSEAAPFVTVVAKVPMVAVARKDLALKSLADLHGFKEVGFLRGGSCGKDIDADPLVHRAAQDSYETAIRKLAAGRLDGWCSIKAGFSYALSALKMEDQIGDQIEYAKVQIGFQVTPGKRDTIETKELAATVDRLVQSGMTDKIFTRYLGATYRP
jgi:ABC-type amino acid transport substrate-binding protein